jgi:drug/metabolite transporter (DMT)-like permease
VLIGLIFAFAAMVLNSVAGLLQSDATTRTTRHRPLAAQPRYLFGLLIDGLAWVCTVVALRHMPVFAVQAILGGSIALTALATRWIWGTRLRPLDRAAIGACVLGLVLVAASAGGESPDAGGTGTSVVLGIAAVALTAAALALYNTRRAWPLALVAGLGFGGTSLAVRAVQVPPGQPFDLVALLAQPATYLVIAFWLIGLITFSLALGRGDLAIVTAVFTVTEVIVPGLVAIGLLGDQIRDGWVVPFVIGLLLAAAGVVGLASSPAQRKGQWVR